jgi:hypothetical protein
VAGYVFDPDDPRAPTTEQWARMLPDERDRVVAMLPGEAPKPCVLDALDDEMVVHLRSMLDRAIAGHEELAAKLADEQRRREEAERQREEAERQREEAERQREEALAEIERLRKGPS